MERPSIVARSHPMIFRVLLGIFLASTIHAQTTPIISYLIPDIGTPGMNTCVEFIGPYNANGNFGTDGLYLNNPNDAVQVVCANPPDSQYVRFGPCVVSWNGRMISTQAFVLPWAAASSSDWHTTNLRIPLQILVNGSSSNVDTFYIVTPQHIGLLTTPGALGSGGIYGIRSRRGAMIIDSLVLSGSGSYTVSTQDCDTVTPGNQGFLPFILICKGVIRATAGSVFSLSADSENAGPGGGGGGGAYSEDTLVAPSTVGGSGYTGGEGGAMLGGEGNSPS